MNVGLIACGVRREAFPETAGEPIALRHGSPSLRWEVRAVLEDGLEFRGTRTKPLLEFFRADVAVHDVHAAEGVDGERKGQKPVVHSCTRCIRRGWLMFAGGSGFGFATGRVILRVHRRLDLVAVILVLQSDPRFPGGCHRRG